MPLINYQGNRLTYSSVTNQSWKLMSFRSDFPQSLIIKQKTLLFIYQSQNLVTLNSNISCHSRFHRLLQKILRTFLTTHVCEEKSTRWLLWPNITVLSLDLCDGELGWIWASTCVVVGAEYVKVETVLCLESSLVKFKKYSELPKISNLPRIKLCQMQKHW